MAVHDALLRVPETERLGDGDDVLEFVHVQVAARAVVVFEDGKNGLVPTAQHLVSAGVFWVEVNARLGAANVWASDGELDFHGLGQRHDLLFREALAHAGAAASCPIAERIDDDPTTGAGFGIVPFKHDFRGFVLVLLKEF
jgi:hypothetical protein